MRILWQLVKRNTLLYLRDRAAVFFSFLSVIIIILMYVLFIGRLQKNGIGVDVEGIDWLVSSWIMAGILTVTTVTVPLGALGTMIKDRQTKIISDFYTSPVDRKLLALSYLLSAWVIGLIMVLLNFVIGQVYVITQGGEFVSFMQFVQLLGLIMLSIMAFSTFFYYISLFMKTQNAFGLLSTLVGTFIGFLGGIYVQIGLLPSRIASVMNMLPTAHSVVLIRNVYMSKPMGVVFKDSHIPEVSEALAEFNNDMGMVANVFGYQLESYQMVLSLVVFGLLFYILSVIKLNKSKL